MDVSEMIAVCGLDCGPCPLRRVTFDAEAAQEVAAWFREQGWLEEGEGAAEVAARGPYCQGCRGDRSVHWSPDCWIRACCVDEKGLSFCSECDVFPCGRLEEWALGSPRYGEALERLRGMRGAVRKA